MQILPMEKKDAEALSLLDMEVFSVPWSKKSFEDESANSLAYYYVAKEDDEIIAYAGFWHVADEGDITNIAVKKEHRKKGVASALLEVIIKKAKELGLELLTLEVRESNIPAINLYKRFGFLEIGKRKMYYKNPKEDALIMTLYFGGIYG